MKSIKRYLTTAMSITGCLTLKKGEIIVSYPKINPASLVKLEKIVEEVNGIFKQLNLGFRIRFVANAAFKKQVLDPIGDVSDDVLDTSELFSKNYHRDNLFSSKIDKKLPRIEGCAKEFKNKGGNPTESEWLRELKIGKLVQKTMLELIEGDKLSQQEINYLMDKTYSKKTFNSNFPILKHVTDKDKIMSLKKDHNGVSRYYAKPLNIYGETYLLSAQWYEDLNRSYYEGWLKSKLS